MNPEEGELRPQLLDRFGLSVDVTALTDVALRTEVLRRQLGAEQRLAIEHPDDPFVIADTELRQRINDAGAVQVEISDEMLHLASRLAMEVGAEGLRADLMLCRAAIAAASLEQRCEVTSADIRSVAELVLGHRRRRRPFDEPGIRPDELDQAWQHATAESDEVPLSGDDPRDRDQHDDAGSARPLSLSYERQAAKRATPGGDDTVTKGKRGRAVRDQPYDVVSGELIDGRASAVALARRRVETNEPDAPLARDDLRSSTHDQRTGSLLLFVVDASASMGIEHRMATTKAAILGLLGDAYRRRGRVGLITFRGTSADLVLRPTSSIEIARARLAEIKTGGSTPIAAGLDEATKVVRGSTGDSVRDCTVIVVTDGRATSGGDEPVAAAHLSIERLAGTGARVVVLDTETGPARLHLARGLADRIGATVLPLDISDEGNLERTVRSI